MDGQIPPAPARLADRLCQPARAKHGWHSGYSSHVYHLTLPNIHKWLKHRTDLFPMVIQVQTINRCNAACEFCPYPYTIHLQDKRIMDDMLYSKIVDECVAEKDLHDFVPMSKNEPLLDTRMEQRVAEFKSKAQPHQIVELVTNGSALTLTRAQRLMEAGVDLITVSVNASNEETYKRVMIGLSWKQVMGNVRTQTIRETYNSPRMNQIRELMSEGKFEEIEACRECSFYHDWMKSPLASNKSDWRSNETVLPVLPTRSM